MMLVANLMKRHDIYASLLPNILQIVEVPMLIFSFLFSILADHIIFNYVHSNYNGLNPSAPTFSINKNNDVCPVCFLDGLLICSWNIKKECSFP
uniref:Uncharacterized protein n=1 Tax=Lepeophtheirus salmonis TaxID=72036 RepID=A0A0K2T9I3_LEPSM